MAQSVFLIQKRAIFRKIKEIESLRGKVHEYAAQVIAKLDAEVAKKRPFLD